MCSIVGAVWFVDDGPPVAEIVDSVKRGLGCLHNRGPDQSAVCVVSPTCVLGGNRLAIRSAPGVGDMPFREEDDICFYNGEIYNFHQWDSNAVSDGEVILPLFREKGSGAFASFDGEFAISIWDNAGEAVYLARDPFGTKPLYFSLNSRRLLWASSANAIDAMEHHAPCTSVRGPVSGYTRTVQEPYTSFRGIWHVPPGHYLRATRDSQSLHCYHSWSETPATSDDPTAAFRELERSLLARLSHDDVVGIPMSGGIDSGIIAFTADALGIKYKIFSVVEMFGAPTQETETICRRLDRLRRPAEITLLSCNEPEYQRALGEIFQPDYYDYETFDDGNIPAHTVFAAMQAKGVQVAIDGSGGDELFHGYTFRNDFRPVPGWPASWSHQNQGFYSLYSTLLAWTAKTDRAGAHFSIETRYPFQSVPLMNEAASLRVGPILKWPLRQYLLKKLAYGSPLPLDTDRKLGFRLKNKPGHIITKDMRRAWRRSRGVRWWQMRAPKPFPFRMGNAVGQSSPSRQTATL